ncbi:hypothetical protein FHX82_002184 [Amycolatopsis bartoniae]|uniref:Uncharacterized protein n=1 Tax=Amycolatopsis bartoniae TaxID=941986 RepID=A0A8H9J453_9PSEU|nr:hypothetical protein [Amycolatopsis bartoniae]MBB2935164.1 hypothetical protein [Amycolatopsis bartoniae]TVT07034.1 hypothetical protein FNH07_18045 [Amycolatopsis bartoniae]GHF74828.1 hypothetical protein GCM10017566_55820 [Amycolatopsis bartoniae]
MDQLSFFSAEASGPRLADLAGVLCGQGQIVSFGRTAARLSVPVAEPWRAKALAAEFVCRGVHADVLRGEDGPLVRTAFRVDLIHLANAWLADEGKQPPDGFRLTGGALRLWALAAGQPNGNHYLLGVDCEAEQLADACRQLGLPAQFVGPRAGGPAVRVTGKRRLATLEELIGVPPPAAVEVWPGFRPPVPETAA